MVHRENAPECIQKYLELENSFPTLKIECVETYVTKKECYSINKRCTTVEQSIQQCGGFKYSIYLAGSFFKAPCGNYIPAADLQYIIGNFVLIKLTNGIPIGGFIVDVSSSGSGNLILDVSSSVNLSNLKVGFDTLTYYPNSAYGFVNHCGFLATQRPIDALPGQKLFLIDSENEIHDVFIDAINESGIHIKPTLVHTSVTKCNLPAALPYNSITSGFYTVVSPFIKITTTEYEPHVVPYGFQKKYLLNNLTTTFKNILNQYIKKVECWANTTCNVDDQDNRLFFCSQPLAVFSCLAGQQYYLGHIQDIFSICGVTDYNILLTSPLNNFPVKTGELYVLLGTIFTNNPDKTITIVDEKLKKFVNYTILSYPETLICNLSRLNPLNYFRDGDVLYNDSFVSSIPIEFVTIVTILFGGKIEFVVEGLNNLVQSCNEHHDQNKQSYQQGNVYENLLRRYAQYNCNNVCNGETFQ
jgi:hypothetical protein